MKSPLEYIRKNEIEKRERNLHRWKVSAVNIMEYDGRLCVASDGVPLLPIDSLGLNPEQISSALSEGRELWVKWNLQNG